ncbi:PadR family transcriptional regulator [Streptomyces puniciscabiei]
MGLSRWTRVAEDATRYVIERHMAEPNYEFYGLELAKALGCGAGTIYPVVRRMEEAGWLLSRTEEPDEPRGTARPPRIYYRINPDNLPAVRQRLAELDARRRAASPGGAPTLTPHPVNLPGDDAGRRR